MKVCHCTDGWICDTHRDCPWPHDACTGPGTLCINPNCLVGRLLRAELADQRQDSDRLRTLKQLGVRDPRN